MQIRMINSVTGRSFSAMNLTDKAFRVIMPRKFLRSIPTDTYDIDLETGEADTKNAWSVCGSWKKTDNRGAHKVDSTSRRNTNVLIYAVQEGVIDAPEIWSQPLATSNNINI